MSNNNEVRGVTLRPTNTYITHWGDGKNWRASESGNDTGYFFCELYLFVSPLGNEVAVDARLAKSKNYNGANDLRYLGYTYEMKFQRDASRYVKKTRKIPCDEDDQWLIEDVSPGFKYRLYVSWTGFWNGFKELDHDVVTEDMIKEILVNDAKEKFVVLSGLMNVE